MYDVPGTSEAVDLTMAPYETPVSNAPLTRLERLMSQLVCSISDAQLSYRYHDLHEPRQPGLWRRLFSRDPALRQWQTAIQYWAERAVLFVPRDPIPLADLWPRVKHPWWLRPKRAESDDLFFRRFLVSYRWRKHPNGRELAYVVAAPTSDTSCRCIADEWSGGLFCTADSKSRCEPPCSDDFQPVGVHSKTFDPGRPPAGVPTMPDVSDLYLPGCYGPWVLFRSGDNSGDPDRKDEAPDETTADD